MSMKMYLYMAMFGLMIFSMKLTGKHLSIIWEETFSKFYEQNFSVMLKFLYTDFMMTIFIITSLIYSYSKFYFSHKKESNKDYFFFLNLLLFASSMLILIASNSYTLVMVGWDGLGVTSFLLIMYYNNNSASCSALTTFNLNRLGDLFMIGFLSLLMALYMPILLANADLKENLMMPMLLLFTVGCMTKSAQLPFSAWLPAAMAAPTPVSALVHSSTLVTAGIFLMLKMSYMNMMFFSVTKLLLGASIVLSLFSGFFALLEKDLKKMVAMSTLSQLGILMFCMCTNNFLATMFHIMSHAFFKSLLFMMAGIVIIMSSNYQDMRKISLAKMSNYSLSLATVITCINLMGWPFTSGFFSKDMILLDNYSTGLNVITKSIFVISCTVSVIYCLKLMKVISSSTMKMSASVEMQKKLYTNVLTVCLIALSLSMGKMYSSHCLEKELYKMFFLEKMIGCLIILVGLNTFLVTGKLKGLKLKKKEYFVKTHQENLLKMYSKMFSNMVNMKFGSTTYFSKIFSKANIVFKAEKIVWIYILNKTVEMGPDTVKTKNMKNLKIFFTIMVTMSLVLAHF